MQGYQVQDLGFRVQVSGFRVQGLGFGVQGLRFWEYGLGFSEFSGVGGRQGMGSWELKTEVEFAEAERLLVCSLHSSILILNPLTVNPEPRTLDPKP